jgi:NAD(P)-dependent dehydrogenase (short-subunit alcohol dehydrogenase family)
MLLTDKVVIVSGIGPGMGREIALACAREGADVTLAARSAPALEDVAAAVHALGRRALCVPTDITKPEDCQRLAERTRRELGRIDVLVNNAFRSDPTGLVESADLDGWKNILEVNLLGSVRLTQAVVPTMKAQQGGAIVMINSMSMRIIEPGMGGYAASKGALMAATQTLAKELGPHGIRVNSVVPGYIWSAKMEAFFRYTAQTTGRTYEDVHAGVTNQTALRHIPDSAEIADTVVFFASDLSRVVTGQALDVNGGHFFH